MGNLKNADGRQDVTVVGEIVISVSSGFVRGSVREGSRDGRNVELTAYFSKSGSQAMQVWEYRDGRYCSHSDDGQ